LGELRDEGVAEILTPAGMRPIDGWHDDGVRDGIKVTCNCGFEIDGTQDHRIWVRDSEGREDWKKLADLDGSEWVAIARGRADWGDRDLRLDWAELLGLLIADGCTIYKGRGIDITKDPHTIEHIGPLLNDWVAACAASQGSQRIRGEVPIRHISEACCQVRATCKGMDAWLLQRFGLTLGKSHERQVPSIVLHGTKDVVCAFLRGYFAGDGEASGSIEATTTSPLLARQVHALLLGAGVWSGLRSRKSVGRPAIRITIRDVDAFVATIGSPTWLNPEKVRDVEKLSRLIRNTNLDTVPGVGKLLRELAAYIPGKSSRKDGWQYVDAYYSSEKQPSYRLLRQMLSAAPDVESSRELQSIVEANFAWSKIKTIESSRVHRIDCEVREAHCYIGNGIINHNTWLFVFIIYAARENGLRSLVLVNTDELVQQTVEKLERVGVNAGIMKAGKNEWTRDVVVASVQTLSKATRLYNLPPNHFGLVITDECHYANAPSYQRVLWYFKDAFHLGVTATPFRGDKKSLAGAGWDTVAFVYPIKKAIEEKWLCPVRFVTVNTGVKIEGVGVSKATLTSEKDFNAKALEKLVNTPERNAKIVEASLEHLVVRDGAFQTHFRRTIAFCAGVAHAVDLANAFRHRGIEAFAIYGSMKTKARRLIIKAHQKGMFPVICNCNILTHGYDDPRVDGLIMARPTKSKVLYLQELGRGLRVSPESGKIDCVCLDVADVSAKHSLTIGSELLALEEAIDERGEAIAPAGLVPSDGDA